MTININDLNLLRAIRCGYGWSRILPREECSDFIQEISRCWKEGDVHYLMNALNLLRFSLGNLEGAHTAYREFSEALSKVGGPGGEGCLPR